TPGHTGSSGAATPAGRGRGPASRRRTGRPGFGRGRSGEYDSSASATKSATAPPASPSASRRKCRPAEGTLATCCRRPAITPPPQPPPGLLHLEHEGEDHRPAVQALEIPAKRLPDLLFHLGRVGARLRIDRAERVEDHGPRPLEHLGARLVGEDTTRHEVGPGHDVARLLGDGEDGEHEAVLGEMAAVAEHHVTHLPTPLPSTNTRPAGTRSGRPAPSRPTSSTSPSSSR